MKLFGNIYDKTLLKNKSEETKSLRKIQSAKFFYRKEVVVHEGKQEPFISLLAGFL